MRIALRDVIELLALPLISAGVYILWDMNQNINKLNIQVGVIIAENGPVKDILKDHELRIRDIELILQRSNK